jgi:transaldolase
MKFFIDTANLDQIREANDFGILDGVTTNPSLMAKEGITGEANVRAHYKTICEIVKGDVSAEVISTDFAGTNCTLVFSAGQAILAAKAGATYLSPFIGRLDDISTEGIDLIKQIAEIYSVQMYETQILAASVRSSLHIVQCAQAGADVVTCPLSAITGLLKHPLTDLGLAQFLADHRKANA